MHIFNYIVIALSIVICFFLFYRFPVLERKNHPLENDLVSVIIPARNEEKNLSNILNDLNNQTVRPHEIICVDDGSDDDTPVIAKQYGAKYIRIDSLPPGWRGKTWACQTGSLAASGRYLLFIDADVRLSETAVGTLLSEINENEPISVQPYHSMVRFYESFSMFFNMIQTSSTRICLPVETDSDGMFGPVFMISKKLFDSMEGYEPVKSRVVEDYYLGKYYKNKNIGINLFLGGKEISFRMYGDGFGQLLEGWAKNFSSGAHAAGNAMLFLTVVWITGVTVIPVELMIALSRGWTAASVLLSFSYAVTALQVFRAARKLGNFTIIQAFFYPVQLLAFHLIFIYSLITTYLVKCISWKGRKLKL